MCPQLFINYKLKSVAHLPWRQMTYKFLNTIIDDLFAFVIKMPTLHRLSVFRDGKSHMLSFPKIQLQMTYTHLLVGYKHSSLPKFEFQVELIERAIAAILFFMHFLPFGVRRLQ